MGNWIFRSETPFSDKHHFSQYSVVLAGWLYKQGRWNKSWKRRYFVLKRARDDILIVYSRSPSDHAVGEICLSKAVPISPESSFGRKHGFVIDLSPGRVWVLAAENDEWRQQWMECLNDFNSEPFFNGRISLSLSSELVPNPTPDATIQDSTQSRSEPNQYRTEEKFEFDRDLLDAARKLIEDAEREKDVAESEFSDEIADEIHKTYFPDSTLKHARAFYKAVKTGKLRITVTESKYTFDADLLSSAQTIIENIEARHGAGAEGKEDDTEEIVKELHEKFFEDEDLDYAKAFYKAVKTEQETIEESLVE